MLNGFRFGHFWTGVLLSWRTYRELGSVKMDSFVISVWDLVIDKPCLVDNPGSLRVRYWRNSLPALLYVKTGANIFTCNQRRYDLRFDLLI